MTGIEEELTVVTLEREDWLCGRVLRWNEYRGDAPEGGDTVWLGNLRSVSESHAEGRSDWRLYVEVPMSSGSDVETDHMSRSNYERIREDFPEHVVSYEGGYGTYGLVVQVGAEVPEELLSVIAGLRDYPVYDEPDYQERETRDFEETLNDALGCAERALDDELLERLTEHEIAELRDAVREEWVESAQAWRSEEVNYQEISDLFTTRAEEVREIGWEVFARRLGNLQTETLPGV